MLKSRRALLAAGISAVVIGTIGVASTLNAGAEEIPEGPAPAAAPVEAEEPLRTPPARLPWGAVPEDIQTGRDGASSGSLKVTGLDAAAPDASGADAGEVYAPKGRTTSRTNSLRRAETSVVPPAPPGINSKAAADSKVLYHYNVAAQDVVTQGAYANLTIHKPTLAKDDFHTLAELAVVASKDKIDQAVEVGWTVNRAVNGDDDPHLFVYSWVDGVPQCYNGCGFEQYSKNIAPGDTLPMDTTKRFGIEFYDNAWWIAYDSEWVGYFPAKHWTIDFSKTTTVKMYGEVASNPANSVPCTQMGNGVSGSLENTTAARIGSISLIGTTTAPDPIAYTLGSPEYTIKKLSARTLRYGGGPETQARKDACLGA
ncbi:neprosin family prolyl endopeptidase [Actinoplanes sp. NPDC026670]|uniref:neprosin family prolyl endopeptidase n=1 Tax=Actinoplanes sp. NPDC026670 TaxID=3154700 RepID=UPI0033FC7FC9